VAAGSGMGVGHVPEGSAREDEPTAGARPWAATIAGRDARRPIIPG
jgi:hypothetical protein